MLIEQLERQPVYPRTLRRDLSASLVGLAAGLAVTGLVALDVPGDASVPAATPTPIAAAVSSEPGVGTRIADLEALNELLTAALARVSEGGDRSVLPPPEIAGVDASRFAVGEP